MTEQEPISIAQKILKAAERHDEYLEDMVRDDRDNDIEFRGGLSLSPSKRFATLFVSVVELDQGYGGPEEGGWYYDVSIVHEVHMVRVWFSPDGKPELRDDEREFVATLENNLLEKYEFGTRHRYSAAPSGEDYVVSVTWNMPEDEPLKRPRYE